MYPPSRPRSLRTHPRTLGWAVVVLALALPATAQVEEARFGWTGALSGTHAAVAAPFRPVDDKPHVGVVTFYERGQAWEQREEVRSPVSSAGQMFGHAVAMEGAVAVVGAPGDAEGGLMVGAAYVYERRGGTWMSVQKLVPSNARFGMKMGTAVALGQGLLAIGTKAGCGTDRKGGCVFIYEKQGPDWQVMARLENPADDHDAAFGADLDIMDAQTILVSAPTGSGGAERGGEVFVFRRDGNDWSVMQHLFTPDGQMGDLFGESIAYADDHLFVGSPGRSTAMQTGVVYAYQWQNGAFEPVTVLEPPVAQDFLRFGQSLTAEGGQLFVGAPRQDGEEGAADVGAIYGYLFEAGTVTYAVAVAGPDPATDHGFGYLVAAEGDQLLIGAPFSTVDDLSGAGRAFFRDADVLTEVVEAPDLPTVFALHENYPNPFNPATTIQYALPRAVPVTITVYNVLGQRVAVLVDAEQAAGRHEVVFEARHLASGVYFYEMRAGDYRAAHRMTLLK